MRKKTTLNQSFWVDPEIEAKKAEIKEFLSAMRFSELKDYYKWCADKNFPQTMEKPRYVLTDEKNLRMEEKRAAELESIEKQKSFVSPNLNIRKIYDSIETQLSTNSHLEPYWNSIKQLRTRCVFAAEPFHPGSTSANNFLINAYWRLVQFGETFIKPVDEIKIKKNNPYSYFQEVVNQLICKYPMPKALISWWFKPAEKWTRAYVSLAQGKKIYDVFKDLETIPLTHRQINLLMNKYAKETISYEKARLQSILETLNSPSKLSVALLRSNIFTEDLPQNYELKSEFIKFLVKNANFFDWSRTLDLWDYINHLRVQTPRAFSFKGRSLFNLVQGMLEWHAALGKSGVAVDDKRVWDKSSINNYYFLNETTTEEVSIMELTSGREIHAEGKIMHHCVYSYAQRCASFDCAIFSMKIKLSSKVEWKPAGTIEVNLRTGQIVQFKDKYNAKPDTKAEFHLRKWADKEKIKVR